MLRRKAFNIALICALICSTMLSMVGFKDSCDEMYSNIIRVRILANSDSEGDQNLKIKVRDAILEKSKELFGEECSYEDAIKVTNESLDILLDEAYKTVKSCGYSYEVKAEFREEFFDTRVYDTFTLPAGRYKTAVFTIGEGKGKNWWCVIYPQVCVGACSGSLTDSISNTASDFAYNAEDYVIKFKTVEIFEKVKKYLFF